MWTGRELLLVGATGPYGIGAAGARLLGAAYDPARDAWRVTSASPVVSGKGARVMRSIDGWSGSELLVVADSGTKTVAASTDARQRLDQSGDTASTAPSHEQSGPPVERRRLLAYDPVADRWATTRLGTAPFAAGSYVWTGSEILAVGSAPSPRAAAPQAAAAAPAPGPGRRLDPCGTLPPTGGIRDRARRTGCWATA